MKQLKNMPAITCSRNDVQIRAFTTCKSNQSNSVFGVVECDDKDLCFFQPGSVQKVRAGRISEKPLVTKLAKQRDSLHVVIQHDGLEPAGSYQTVHDLSKAPDANDNDRAFFVDCIRCRSFLGYGGRETRQEFIGDEKHRCCQHRHGHNEQQFFR